MKNFLCSIPRFAAALVLSFTGLVANAQTGDLFISEYLEGSSNNKSIEIFNGTGSPVNLATGGEKFILYPTQKSKIY